MKRAFTLIELLVVIAIIAILAAILFPVFAQAKEAAKKTQTLSNAKQLATSVLLYTGDNSDTAPSAFSYDNSIGWLWNYGIGVPNGWEGVPEWTAGDANQWMNSTEPYRKSYDLVSGAGMPRLTVSGYEQYTNAPVRKPAEIHFSMNGLLNTYSMTAVARPSEVPLIWGGHYKQNLVGLSLTNPAMQCTVFPNGAIPAPPCVFNPGGHPQTGAGSAGSADGWFTAAFNSASVRTYTNGNIFVATDSSAKFVPIGTGTGMVSYKHPFNTVDARGIPSSANRCRTSASAPAYLSVFRPDLTEARWGAGPVSASAPLCQP